MLEKTPSSTGAEFTPSFEVVPENREALDAIDRHYRDLIMNLETTRQNMDVEQQERDAELAEIRARERELTDESEQAAPIREALGEQIEQLRAMQLAHLARVAEARNPVSPAFRSSIETPINNVTALRPRHAVSEQPSDATESDENHGIVSMLLARKESQAVPSVEEALDDEQQANLAEAIDDDWHRMSQDKGQPKTGRLGIFSRR